MGKFNTKNIKDRKFKKNSVVNRAGGYSYDLSTEMKFVGLVFTSLVNDESNFYRNNKSLFTELEDLMKKCDPEFMAKVCWKARQEYGLRSITHLVAAFLAKNGYTSGVSWGSKFFESIIVRPDDITEILSILDGKISHAMRKGFSHAMQNFDEYQLAKYSKFQNSNGKINLNDVARLCHVPFDKGTGDPLEKLMYRTLKNTDTLESINNSEEGYIRLLSENKLGYTALIKNLKNIINKKNSKLIDLTCQALVNETSIKNSMLLPSYFLTAYTKLKSEYKNNIDSIGARKVVEYLSRACDISLKNIPKLKGKTLILIDQSGSMKGVKDIAHLFACSLAHACDEYVAVRFSSSHIYSFYANKNKNKNRPMEYIDTITENNILNTVFNMPFMDGGTDFCGTYDCLSDDCVKVDRVIQITDQQDWCQSSITGIPSYMNFKKWCKKVGMNPEVWSIDVAGLGTSVFPEDKMRIIYGLSSKIFDIIPELEKNKNALINGINNVEFLTKKELKFKQKQNISFEVEED